MQGTVEALMADQARKTVGQYVDYIGCYVEAALEEMNNQRKQQQQQPGAAAAVSFPAALQPAGPAELHVEGPRTPAESADAAVAAAPPALAAAAPAPPPAAGAAVGVTALVPAGAPAAAAAPPQQQQQQQQQQQLLPAGAVVPAAAELADVFYDASEVLAGSGLDLLLRELREERAARLEANRCVCGRVSGVPWVGAGLAWGTTLGHVRRTCW
jgi:hypothetical protein